MEMMKKLNRKIYGSKDLGSSFLGMKAMIVLNA
jgi:hypothetical protein